MITVVFENDHCIAVDKPAQWLSVPGRDPKDTRPILGRELESQLQRQIFPIHRLDAEVTGLIVYGKTADFHREANKLFENKKIQKTYQAFTDPGAFQKGQSVRWHSKLLRGKKRAYEANYGKSSLTEGTVFDQSPQHLEWRLNPLTGRSHQLRFELYKHDCPIWGDELYGSRKPWPDGIALRALALDWPEDFAQAWNLDVKFQVKPLSRP